MQRSMQPAAAPAPPIAPLSIVMEAQALNAFLARAFPHAEPGARGEVTEVSPGRVRMMLPFAPRLLRPGGVISGPTLMGVADSATYALVLAHIGEQAMAVTTSLTMHFLRGCKPGALQAEARLLKLGRRIATADVRLWTEETPGGGPDAPAAQATVAYALPDAAR